MQEALSAIDMGMGVSKAALTYGIPRTTLNDHKLGKVLAGAHPGRPTLLICFFDPLQIDKDVFCTTNIYRLAVLWIKGKPCLVHVKNKSWMLRESCFY